MNNDILIVIDPGHGGVLETGAVASGYKEKDLNLETSKFLKEELEQYGFKVLLTRDTDKQLTLKERGNIAKNNNAKFFISVHFNAFTSTAKGFEVIYSYNSPESEKAAKCIYNEAIKLGMSKRSTGVWTKKSSHGEWNWYGVLRSTYPVPAVIVEGLFLTSPEDIKFLQEPGFLKRLASAYAVGICNYFGVSLTKELSRVEVLSKMLQAGNLGDVTYWLTKFNLNEPCDPVYVEKVFRNVVKNMKG